MKQYQYKNVCMDGVVSVKRITLATFNNHIYMLTDEICMYAGNILLLILFDHGMVTKAKGSCFCEFF